MAVFNVTYLIDTWDDLSQYKSRAHNNVYILTIIIQDLIFSLVVSLLIHN